MEQNEAIVKRPTWDEYFLRIAKVVSERSHDAQTKVGCVIVGQSNRILSTGYNGFPPGFQDDILPTTRPGKYEWMVHAEANAIASTEASLRGATLYCTHDPCRECSKLILTAGIRKVVIGKKHPGGDEGSMLLLGGVIYVYQEDTK